jgi:hypothetical protein
MGEKKLHIQSRAENRCKRGLKKFQTDLLGFEIREKKIKKICQVPTNRTMYWDILKETSNIARRNGEGLTNLVTLQR